MFVGRNENRKENYHMDHLIWKMIDIRVCLTYIDFNLNMFFHVDKHFVICTKKKGKNTFPHKRFLEYLNYFLGKFSLTKRFFLLNISEYFHNWMLVLCKFTLYIRKRVIIINIFSYYINDTVHKDDNPLSFFTSPHFWI